LALKIVIMTNKLLVPDPKNQGFDDCKLARKVFDGNSPNISL